MANGKQQGSATIGEQLAAKASTTDMDVLTSMAQYGEPIVSWPKYDGVNESKWVAGERSTKIADIVVPINGINAKIDCAMYARLGKIKHGVGAGDTGISFEASCPKALSFASKDDKDRFLGVVERAVLAWSAYKRAEDAACERLTNSTSVKAADAVRPELRPRLVKAPKQAEASA